MKDLAGKVAFVTGAANGLGLAMARSFVGAGMKVVLADVEKDALAAAVASFDGANSEVHGIVVDVTDRDALAAAADEAEATFGAVHVLCNNAGVAAGGSLDAVSYDDWDWVMGVNVGGVINGIQTFIERIKKHGEGGHIVNTASMAGFMSAAGGIYAASKFAVVGLSESLRADMAPHNIGVSVLAPAFVATRIHEAERNRPDAFDNGEGAVLDEENASAVGSLIEAGIDPAIVGECVLDGVRNNQLYLFPHPEFKDALEARFDQVLGSMDQSKGNEDQLHLSQGAAHQMRGRNIRDTD